MPVYRITAPNGVTYETVGPPGATPEQIKAVILKAHPEAGVPPQEENALEKVPLVGDAAAWLADLPLEYIGGLAGTSKTFTDAFEARAASEFLDDVSKGALSMRSSESRRNALINALDQQQAEQGGTWEELKAAGRSLARSPFGITASVAGSTAPFIGAGLVAAAAAPTTGGASILIPAAAMAGAGAVSGMGLIKGEVYDAVYEATYQAAIENGSDEATAKTKAEEVAERAQEYGGKNTDQIALGAALSAVASATGFSRHIATTIGRRAAQRVAQRAAQRAAGAKTPGAVRSFITGAVEEFVPEAIQAGQERYARNVAQQREGFDVDTWRGVAGQAAFEGIASLVLGGYGGVRSAKVERKLLDDTAEEFNAITPDADEKAVSAAVQRFVNRGFNQETAESIVRNMQAQKAAIDEQAAKMEQQRQERTAGAEPSAEPDINAPGMPEPEPEFAAPPVDPEEEAARERAYAEQMGEAVVSPFEFDGRDYGSYRALEAERQRTLQEQAKREELLFGDTGKLSAYAQSKGISDVEMHRLLTDNYRVGQDTVTRLTKKLLGDDMQSAAQAEKTRAAKVKFTDITDAPEVEAARERAQRLERAYAEQMGAAPRTASSPPQWILDNARAVVDTLRSRNPKVLAVVEDLHAQDFTAKEISAATGLDDDTVRAVRIGLGLPEQGKASGFLLNVPGNAAQRAAFEAWRDSRAAQSAPKQTAPQPTDITDAPYSVYPPGEPLVPARAARILEEDEDVQRFADTRGIDEAEAVEILSAVARGEATGLKYSRGRRPKDTDTADMFAGAPLQEAPGEAAKREELAAQRFATDEDRAARQEQFTAEMEAGQERVLAMRQREEADREETLGDIEYALRAQAPENAVYKVEYNPEDANPYKLVAETQLGKKPEEVLSAKTLQDFSDQVYGRMMELTPYIPEAPAAIQEIEERESGEQVAPTAATRMVQEFTAEVDAAREQGLIDNNQRAQLLGRLERPNAYRALPNGRQVPNDAIAKLEKEALDAASAAANAPADQKEATAAASKGANDRLRAAVKNSLLNPARAALKSMVETRQLEREGAGIRKQEAESTVDKFVDKTETAAQFAPKRGRPAKFERVPGTAGGATQVGIEEVREDETQAAKRAALRKKRAGTSATDESKFGELTEEERETLREARKEARDAEIDLKEAQVQKYRRGAPKQPGGPPKVVSVERVRAIVDGITSKWKSKFRVVVLESVMDLDDRELRRAIIRDGAFDANGFVAPDGTVYLVADNLLTEQDVRAVLFHESLGHLGLEQLFRNNLDNALVTMYRGNAKLRADTDKWRQNNPGAYEADANPLARAVEEVLAERSENGQLERSFFDKIAAIIRNFARRMGFTLKISDGDVAAILSMAHDKIVKGDAESAIVKGLRYVNVWHGSRANFDKFDMGFLGTGEGAQRFGWGLYFTDTRQIAEHQYRDQLAGFQYFADGKPLTEWADETLKSLGIPYSAAIKSIQKHLRQHNSVEEMLKSTRMTRDFEAEYLAEVRAEAARDRGPEDEGTDNYIRYFENELARWNRELAVLEQLAKADVRKVSAGKLYNVELAPSEDEFLLWDEEITKQSPKVLAALRSFGFRPQSRFEKVLDVITLPRALRLDVDGGYIYEALVEELGSPKEASLALLAAGIRGNKYLDGWSRGPNAGNPNYNYVLFSDEDVEIIAKYSRPKMPPKERKKAEAAAEGLSTGARRVKDTISVYGMEDGLNEATGANSKARDALTYVEDMSSPVRIGVLKGMPTSGILNWLRRKTSPEIHKLARTVGDTVSKMVALRGSLTRAAQPVVRGMDDFTRKYGSEALAELRFTARINGVDPLAFGTVEAALKGDTVLKPVEDALLKNSNNKAKTRRLIDEIKAQVAKTSDGTQVFKDDVKLSPPVRAKLNALAKLAIDNSKVTLKVEQLAARTQEVRDTYIAKEALSKQKGGLALYKAERDYHKDMFDARVALLDERATDSFNPEQAKKVREVRAEIMREVQSPEERQKGGDLFWDIDPELFAKDYFPMMRDGDYWLRVSEDVKARREEALYVFKSARELAKAQRQLAKQLGVDPNDRTVLKTGNRLADLQNTIRSEDELMKRVFDIVDRAKSQYSQSGKADMQELVDAIYQTYLLTTPERSARRRFMHAKEIAGFSLNVYNNFSKQVATNANELTKLAYAGKVRADVAGLKAAINTPDRPGKEAVMLDDFARELEFRAEQEINPPPAGTLNAVINVLNRVSFLYFLTSAKTALTNFANLPIRVVPRFWRDYGYAEGTAMWLKYMQMWKSLGLVKIEHTNMRFGDYLDAVMPNVNGSSFVKNNADLQWAMKAGTERGVLMTTADTISQSERGNPLRQQTGAVRTAQDVAANVLKSMTFLFTGTENISRQATFYMAFELELKKQKREHPTKALEAQRQAALTKAVEIVDDTMGNFANWERPSLTKGELSRAFFLFKMHPILQTKFMVGAFRDIVAAPLRGVARQATGRGKLSKEDTAEVAGALKELSGVLMMSGLLGGIAAMPLYTAMVEALAYAFEPDPDDDDDVNKLMREDVANAYDADIAFRRWLSGYLGVDESGESQLANILIDGPVGVLTDTEMSSTVSLDLVKLWYREPIAGDNLESTSIAALIANVAGLSTASQIMRGADELEKGNTREALKKISPAFFRSWVNAYYNSTEGVKNRKDDTIIPKEKITASDTFRSVLGARSLRLSKWQDYSTTALKNEDRINKERQEIFDEIEQMRDNGEFATMEDFRAYWNEVVVPFNRTYPNERFIITEESVERSLRARDERGSRTVDGRLINKKDAERILRSQELFRPK